jgi:hypothetical protein
MIRSFVDHVAWSAFRLWGRVWTDLFVGVRFCYQLCLTFAHCVCVCVCVCLCARQHGDRPSDHSPPPFFAAWRGQVGDPGEKSASDVLSLFDVWACFLSQVTAFTCLHIFSIYNVEYVRVDEVFNVACVWTVNPVLVQRIMPYLRLSYSNISVTCAVYALTT